MAKSANSGSLFKALLANSSALPKEATAMRTSSLSSFSSSDAHPKALALHRTMVIIFTRSEIGLTCRWSQCNSCTSIVSSWVSCDHLSHSSTGSPLQRMRWRRHVSLWSLLMISISSNTMDSLSTSTSWSWEVAARPLRTIILKRLDAMARQQYRRLSNKGKVEPILTIPNYVSLHLRKWRANVVQRCEKCGKSCQSLGSCGFCSLNFIKGWRSTSRCFDFYGSVWLCLIHQKVPKSQQWKFHSCSVVFLNWLRPSWVHGTKPNEDGPFILDELPCKRPKSRHARK